MLSVFFQRAAGGAALILLSGAVAYADGNEMWDTHSGGKLREFLTGPSAAVSGARGIKKADRSLLITISRGDHDFFSDTDGKLSVIFKQGATYKTVRDAIGLRDESAQSKPDAHLCLLHSLKRVPAGDATFKFRVEMYAWDDGDRGPVSSTYESIFPGLSTSACPVLMMQDVNSVYGLDCMFEDCELSLADFKKIFGSGVMNIRALAPVAPTVAGDESDSDVAATEFETADSSVEAGPTVGRTFFKRSAGRRPAAGRF